MRVALYAVKNKECWHLWVSLNIQVDNVWWSGVGGEGWNGQSADKRVLLSADLPLGWAVKLRDNVKPVKGMQEWTEEHWAGYLANLLQAEINEEQEAGGEWKNSTQFHSTASFSERTARFALSAQADRLVEALSGRSLLQSEVEALLEEKEPLLADTWQAAAQLAHLQGRLKLEAACSRVEESKGKLRRWSSGIEKRATRTESPQKAAGEARRGRGSREVAGDTWSESVARDTVGDAWSGRESRRVGVDAWSERKSREVVAEELKESEGRDVRARLPSAGSLLRAAALRLPRLRLPLRGGAVARRADIRCLRCGSVATGRTACAACGLTGCAYCEACLALGRSRACALLLRSASLPAVRCTAGVSPTVAARRWGLSSAQAGAAGAALGFLAEPRQRSAAQGPGRFLLWAVTGAGKTEITFPLLEAVLRAGGRVLIATPRRDVVLELAPRLGRAFPDRTLSVLYGGSPDCWSQSQMVLATTHQLLRFHQGFDLVIIDELDAFPYVNDPMLAFAAEHACKPDGRFIYLSATPPPELQRQAHSGRLPHARVPVRFHGHPLPVPQHLTMAPVQQCLKRRTLPGKLKKALGRSFAREAQIFVFVSRISHIAGLLSLLRRSFPGKAIEGTSSQDPERAEKVAGFRSRAISLLVTTTILERGVTVPRSDVFILDADSGLFDEASLVQMAGRAGRSKDDPDGSVIFLSPQWSRSQRGAISQIRTMNAIARRQGLISKEKWI
ncbi:helicase-related protein [Paenibacillus sp. FSL L8-0340]|uniref:DEAD/DEAH box helicase n=1 Tax=Paenibacillus sp. FSL L8-0340 TaxID=2954685 RepID=UPI003158886F